MTGAAAALCVVHVLFAFSTINPVVLLVGQGLAYCSFGAVLWPSISYVVQSKYLGIGYGFVFSIQNIGMTIFPPIIATIYTDSNDKYIPNVEIFFIGCGIVSFILGCILNYCDYMYKFGLNVSN